MTIAVLALGSAANVRAESTPAPTPRAYVIGEIAVSDPEGYKAYVAAATPLVAKYGGVYLARGGRMAMVEGAAPAGRVVVVAFPSLAAALAFEASAAYLEVAKIRHRAATSRLFIVEGVAP